MFIDPVSVKGIAHKFGFHCIVFKNFFDPHGEELFQNLTQSAIEVVVGSK